MTKKIIETPVVLTELQEPIAVTEEGIELNKVIDVSSLPRGLTEPMTHLFPTDELGSLSEKWEKQKVLNKEYVASPGPLEIRLNELAARLDYNDRRIAVLMKDREAYIRLMHGRMNNEVGLQAMINGWEDA